MVLKSAPERAFEMKSWQEKFSARFLWVLIVPFVWLMIEVCSDLLDTHPSSPWSFLVSVPLYYPMILFVLILVCAALLWKYAPERKAELARNESIQQSWNKFYNAFMNGAAADYPNPKASDYGFMLQPGERAYMGTTRAVMGVGNTHQLERTESTSVGLDFKAAQTGMTAATKDSYATIRYNDDHPGSLMISNQRVSFVSARGVFIDLSPDKIQSVACNDQFVMMRTTLTPDETKNLIAIRIDEGIPAWLFAAAIHRLRTDYAASSQPTTEIK